ncbi:MAG: outer membrane beta-barrel protein [Gemmatimonadota bacterium]|nr:outer membrane beta-barrel protein [Gemmatimonadota bacterium]
MRWCLPSALALMLFALPGRARAQDGWYLGMQLGAAAAPGMDVRTGGLDDWSSSDVSSVRCDMTLNPDRVQVEPGACSDVPQPWGPLEESFGGGRGILAGMVLGYRMRSLRVEGEYVYRIAAHDDVAVPHDPATNYDPTRDASFDVVRDAVDNVASHSAFANLYYHFRTGSKAAPYVGMGVGFSRVTVEYRTLWHRTRTIENVRIFDPAGERGEEMNSRLLGANTIDRARLSDSLLGYQAVAGLDYQVGGQVTLGFNLRWMGFAEFNGESEYDRLRGHASVAGNPPVPVTYYVRTDDVGFLAFNLDMKSHF